MSLPPYQLITTAGGWQNCLSQLRGQPRLALDLEANSMYAYQEQICLIQISIPGQDFIVDPLNGIDLAGLGEIIENPAIEKVLHAAEYDLMLMKREHGWELKNLFDTMWAARILGYSQVGLANLLQQFYGVKLSKRYQKANWQRRPLSPAQLTYAQADTHYLLDLRRRFLDELRQQGRLTEANEIFAEQCYVEPADIDFDPDGFWHINQADALSPQGLAILKALYLYREQQARRQNRPHFKILGDRTLLELAEMAPRYLEELYHVHGMTKGQVQRYGRALLRTIRQAQNGPAPQRPPRRNRTPRAVYNRYERLHTWRKKKAQARGVESDVILSRDTLWRIAWENPQNERELAQLNGIGPHRCQMYAQEILKLL